MFKNFPKVGLASPSEPIDYDFELRDKRGCILYQNPEPIEDVKISIHTLLRITKHAREKTSSEAAGGRLCGLHIGRTVEITSVMPDLSGSGTSQRYMNPADFEKAKEKYDRDLRESMRVASIGSAPVGYYVIGEMSHHFSKNNIDNLSAEADKNGTGLLLGYDARRTDLGRLFVRAYVLTDEYVTYLKRREAHKAEVLSYKYDREREKEWMRDSGVYNAGVLREVPVSISVSIEQKLLIERFVPNPELPRLSNKRAELLKYAENKLSALGHSLTNKTMKSSVEYAHSGMEVVGLLALTQAREQAVHIESVCDSILLNVAVVKEV